MVVGKQGLLCWNRSNSSFSTTSRATKLVSDSMLDSFRATRVQRNWRKDCPAPSQGSQLSNRPRKNSIEFVRGVGWALSSTQLNAPAQVHKFYVLLGGGTRKWFSVSAQADNLRLLTSLWPGGGQPFACSTTATTTTTITTTIISTRWWVCKQRRGGEPGWPSQCWAQTNVQCIHLVVAPSPSAQATSSPDSSPPPPSLPPPSPSSGGGSAWPRGGEVIGSRVVDVPLLQHFSAWDAIACQRCNWHNLPGGWKEWPGSSSTLPSLKSLQASPARWRSGVKSSISSCQCLCLCLALSKQVPDHLLYSAWALSPRTAAQPATLPYKKSLYPPILPVLCQCPCLPTWHQQCACAGAPRCTTWHIITTFIAFALE